jgi:hypothetical protein
VGVSQAPSGKNQSRAGSFRARLAAALPWMMAHQRRHLLQEENVKRQIVSAAPKINVQAV